MRHLADPPPYRVAQQPRIGIQRGDKRMPTGTGGAPSQDRQVVSVAPRSSRFSSVSLPRLRSHPIRQRCAI
jgi:hypothetical protein